MATAAIENPSPVTIEMGEIALALRFDPELENTDPILRGTTLGLLITRNLTLYPGINTVPLQGALVNPDTFPELNPGQSSEEVRRVAGIFFSRFLQVTPQLVGVVGFGAEDVFLARKSWPEYRDPKLPPMGKVAWLDESLKSIQNVITFQHDIRKGMIAIEKVRQ